MVNPDLERLAILRPDLVLVSTEGTPPRITDALATAGLAWYAIRIETPDDLFNSLRRLSALFPDPAARSQTIAALESRHSALRGRLAGRKLFFQYGGIAPVYSFGKGSLVSALCHTAGGTNLGDAGIGRFPSFGPENLRSLAPERVIILETGSRPPAEWTRFWKRIVPDARLQMAPPDPFQRPGPRLIEAFHELADTL
jgi:ABC-type Fe3+-hydroxamate transport system substrate-binding protein